MSATKSPAAFLFEQQIQHLLILLLFSTHLIYEADRQVDVLAFLSEFSNIFSIYSSSMILAEPNVTISPMGRKE
jgi:hypothetical protein